MRVLTVRQPWAWAIIHGGKDVENRTRNLAGNYRGPVAIHAGLAEYEKNNLASRRHRSSHGTETPTEVVFGGVIGVVDLVDVHASVAVRPFCCGSEWGQFVDVDANVHLVLADPRPLAKPIPARGRLGLWTPDPDLLAEINTQLQETR